MTGPSLPELWRMAAQHHDALKGFVLAKAALWHDADIRRNALHGLAVLAATLRRLLHLLAHTIVLSPVRQRAKLPPLPRSAPRRLHYRFRLTEAGTPATRRRKHPDAAPEPTDISHARVLERLAGLASIYRRRQAIARRLARRAQSGRAPLRMPPPPASLWPRLAPVFRQLIEHLAQRLEAPDTS